MKKNKENVSVEVNSQTSRYNNKVVDAKNPVENNISNNVGATNELLIGKDLSEEHTNIQEVSQPEESVQMSIKSMSSENNLNTNKTKRNESKTLYIIGIIVVIIGVLVEVGLYVYKNVNKNGDNKDKGEGNKENVNLETLTNDDIMKKYGDEFLLIVNHYIEKERVYPVYEDIRDSVLKLEYNVECREINIYKYNFIYLGQCSVNDSSYIYSYGNQLIEEDNEEELPVYNIPDIEESVDETKSKVSANFDFNAIEDTPYKSYNEVEITKLNKYEPNIIYFKDNNIVSRIGVINEKGFDGYVEIEGGKVYIRVADQSIEVKNVGKVKKALVHNSHDCENMYSYVYILNSKGEIYTIYLDSKSYKNESKLTEYIEKQIKNKSKYVFDYVYTDIILGYENYFEPGCGRPHTLFAKTKKGNIYALDEDKSTIVEKYFPYAYKSNDILVSFNYEVGLDGIVYLIQEDKRVSLGFQANYIFAITDEEDNAYHYILSASNNLYVFDGTEINNNSEMLVKKSVTNIHYRLLEDDYYSIIFTFADNTTLEIENAEVYLNKL